MANCNPFHVGKRSISADNNEKLTKKTKKDDEQNTQISSHKVKKNSKLKKLAKQPKLQPKSSGIRTRHDIETNIELVTSLTCGQLIIPTKYEKDSLVSFWHSSIYECVACKDKHVRKFSAGSWKIHIKKVHGIGTLEYKKRYGNPDITNFKHSCYLCGSLIQQKYSILKRHLQSLHDGMSVESYTSKFKVNILQERSQQPILPSNTILEGWTDGCMYSCTECSYILSSTVKLEKHMLSQHKHVSATSVSQCKPLLVRYHKCYLCEKKMRHEYRIIYWHIHFTHNLDINTYTSKFKDYISMELKAKSMNYILEHEADIMSRPSLANYLDSVKLANKSKVEYDQDWPNFCEYKCFCGEVLNSFLKFHLHVTRKHRYKSMTEYKKEHEFVGAVQRLHTCMLCKKNISWEASRIRDHLKKHKERKLDLQQYYQTFRQEILEERSKLTKQSYRCTSVRREEPKLTAENLLQDCCTIESVNQSDRPLDTDQVKQNNKQEWKENIDENKTQVDTADISKETNEYSPNTRTNSLFVIDPSTGEITYTSSDQIANLQQFGNDNAEIYIAASNILPSLLNDEEEVYDQSDEYLDDDDDESETGSLTGRIVVIPGDHLDHNNENRENLVDDENQVIAISDKIAVLDNKKDKEFDNITFEEPTSNNNAQYLMSDESSIIIMNSADTNTISPEIDQQDHVLDQNIVPANIMVENGNVDLLEEICQLSEETEEMSSFIVHLSADGNSYVVSKVVNNQEKVDQSDESFNNLPVEEFVSEHESSKVENNTEEDNDFVNDTNQVESSQSSDIEVLNAMSNPVKSTKDDNISNTEGEEGNTNVNVLSNILSDKSFQSIVMGTEGQVQRIAVIHRKGDSNNTLDRTVLLNHISNIINNINDDSHNNLKIIEIQVDTDEVTTATPLHSAIPIEDDSSASKIIKKRNGTKSVTGSRNSYGFSIKTISLPVRHDNNTISKGTQVCKWTKMGEDLQKIARHKIIEAAEQRKDESNDKFDDKISESVISVGGDGVMRQSIGVQVVWESRVRGVVDLDEEITARQKISHWILTSSHQLQTSRHCPGCNKVFARNRNLLQHLRTKHDVQLVQDQTSQKRIENERVKVSCPDCGINILRKSYRRHQRQFHPTDL